MVVKIIKTQPFENQRPGTSGLRKKVAVFQAQEHLLDFRPRIGRDFQCPRRWDQHETRSALVAVHGRSTDDILRCHACGADYLIPVR